ncbi:MAG: hypothetical protein JJ908_09345 [Rhizobiales bacterium]|nr:hypothetical protein [Hyphomicrobiales bacterium]MBO6699024.1 hypothetical protein [Hyphomicrobiales bacterium]MBO6736562.1 hypothetical protein [Hyphomicrobiales bacterium]MBO6912364.1 hypothetical protein [Hyphomicrobiales bacterium]MBO6956274.1 hypothetical protein [Hyphomicrobiales bacterium]
MKKSAYYIFASPTIVCIKFLEHTSMIFYYRLFPIILIFTFFSWSTTLQAGDVLIDGRECLEDLHYPTVMSEYLAITEFAIMSMDSRCPETSLGTVGPIEIRRGQRLYFWVRLQGDKSYSNLPDFENEPVFMVFQQFLRGIPLAPVRIGAGFMNKNQIDAEVVSLGRGTTFDWRTDTRRREALVVPGHYNVWIEHRGRRICPINQMSSDCGVRFSLIN